MGIAEHPTCWPSREQLEVVKEVLGLCPTAQHIQPEPTTSYVQDCSPVRPKAPAQK